MTAEELYKLGMKKLKTFNPAPLWPALRAANQGAQEDVRNINGCANYQWASCVMPELKPKQVVELGGAMGVWDICVLNYLPPDSKLYSITLPEGGLEFSYVVDVYPNFIPVLGNDLDLSNWPKSLDLSKTDFWYFDALHTEEHLTKELEVYSPFFRKGAVILFDDIHSFGLDPVWDKVKAGTWGQMDCYDATDPLHYTGYGIACVL